MQESQLVYLNQDFFCHSTEMTRSYFAAEKDSWFLTENNEHKIHILCKNLKIKQF